MIKKICLVLLLHTLVVPAVGTAETSVPKEPLQIAKNRLASFENRKKAIDQIQLDNDLQATIEIAQLIRNSEESMALRGHVIQKLVNVKNQWADAELKKVFKDTNAPKESRRLALYGLWKKDAQTLRSDLISLAQDRSESVGLRMAALSYLGESKESLPPKFWLDLYTKNDIPAPIRIAALNGIEKVGLLAQNEVPLLQIIQNPRESIEVRKSSILTGSRLLSSDALEQELIKVVSNPENPLEMRRFVLNYLASNADVTLVPQLKIILSQEKNTMLSRELETTIKNLASK